jgi:glycosyltransferase involved in cell wall biosynthesis
VNGHSIQPLVTIGIPTYNRAALLKSCVQSALTQTYSNIEVVVSDNASTDHTQATLKSFNDARLRIVSNSKNVGHVGNFNRCLSEAKGEYFVLLCDDNVVDSTFLEKCVRLVEKEPSLPVVLAAYNILMIDDANNEKKVVPAVLSRKFGTGIWDGTDILIEYLCGRISTQTLSSIIRTDFLRTNGGYSGEHQYACDEASWLPVLLEGRAGLVNEQCATFIVHNTRVSSDLTADYKLRDLIKVMEEIFAKAERKIRDPAMRRKIYRATMCNIAHRAIQELAFSRRNGAGLFESGRRLWGWRALLARCQLVDFLVASRLRLLGRILLPRPVVRLLSGSASIYAEKRP